MPTLLTMSAAWNLVYGSASWFGCLACQEESGEWGADTSESFSCSHI